MKSILTAICAFISAVSFTQTAPNIQWQKSLGGSDDDFASSIKQTKDGGYIVAGYSYSNDKDVSGHHSNADYWIVKLNKNGIIQWQKSLGGNSYDQANSIQQTVDGGYIIAGSSYSYDGDVSGNHGGADYWIVKLSNKGEIEWQKSLGGSSNDAANCIQQTSDGGYIIAGSTASNDGDVSGNHLAYLDDYWIVKLNKNGVIQWQKCFGGTKDDVANSIQQTSDEGYIIAGYSFSKDGDVSGNHGGPDYWIIKLTKNGDLQWEKSFGGGNYDYAFSTQQTFDGGYVVAGYSFSHYKDVSGNHGVADYWIVKLTKNGDLRWQKCLGGSKKDGALSIQQTYDSGYVVAGTSPSNDGDVSGNHGSYDDWVVKLTEAGNIKWQKSLGGSGDELAYSIQQTADSSYIVAGYSNSNDGDVSGNHGDYDYWIIKLSKNGSSALEPEAKNLYPANENAVKTKSGSSNFIVYPNPAGDILYVQTNSSNSFSFMNSSGKVLFTKSIGENGSIDISAIPSGTYFLKNNTTGLARKVIIAK